MIRMALILFLFAAAPLLLMAGALRSPFLAVAAVSCGIGLVLLFVRDSPGRVLDHFRALPLDAGASALFQRIWASSAPGRIEADFFEFRSPDSEALIWVRHSGAVTILFSRGFLETVTEQGLSAMFSELDRARLRVIFLENRRFAVSLRFRSWKGNAHSFRYWLVSFWLFPIERLLFIARI